MLLVPLAIALGSLNPPAGGAGDDMIRARYEVDLIGRSQAVFALPPGPRTIRGFRWVPDPDTPDAWRSARLRLVWDGEEPSAAGVDVPLGRFVEPERGGAGPSPPPGLVNRRPMPYRHGARLVIDAEGPLRGSFRIDAGPVGTELDRRGYLRAEVAREGEEPGPGPPAAGPAREIGGDRAGVPGPPLRYWYDRRPGPAPDRPGAEAGRADDSSSHRR